MTQAFNLSQLANNVNTSGLLNAAAGLYNQLPVANGGTGKASVTSGRLLIGAGTAAMTELAGAATNDVVTWNGSAWVSGTASGGALQTYTIATTPGTWTKPATIKGIKVTVVGGGGNSGSAATSNSTQSACGGGGGGAGGTAIRLYPAPSLPGPQPYTVGTAGGTSSFGVAPITVISATGGSNGGNASLAGGNITGANGGAGGVGSNGNANMNGGGGSGGAGNTQTSFGFGFSGLGGTSTQGGGGVSYAGTVNAVVSQTGPNGGAYGAGASGGFRSGTAPNNNPGTSPGGTGATGVVIIEEFY